MAADSVQLGKALKAARERKQLEQADVAEALGVSRTSVSNWERGASAPSEQNMLKLAELYGVTPAALRYGEDGERRAYRPGNVREVFTAPSTPEEAALRDPTQRQQVYVQQLLLEFAQAGVPRSQIDEARDLLMHPQVFTYAAGGHRQEFTEEQAFENMRGMAAYVRRRLKLMGYGV